MERLEHWAEIVDLTPDALGSAQLDLASGFAVPGLAVIASADLGSTAERLATLLVVTTVGVVWPQLARVGPLHTLAPVEPTTGSRDPVPVNTT